jgi:hypothetical protein
LSHLAVNGIDLHQILKKDSNIQITKVVPSATVCRPHMTIPVQPTIRPTFTPFNNGHQYSHNTQRPRFQHQTTLMNSQLNDFLKNSTGSIQPDEEVVVDEEEELGHAETYADYMPSKLQIGIRHPDPVSRNCFKSGFRQKNKYSI